MDCYGSDQATGDKDLEQPVFFLPLPGNGCRDIHGWVRVECLGGILGGGDPPSTFKVPGDGLGLLGGNRELYPVNLANLINDCDNTIVGHSPIRIENQDQVLLRFLEG